MSPTFHPLIGGVKVKVARSQKCLGVVQTDTRNEGVELTARSIQVKAACRPIKKALAPREALSLRAKVLYSEAFGASKGFYACALWRPFTVANKKRVPMVHEFIYRCALGFPTANSSEFQVSYEKVLALVEWTACPGKQWCT
eukprot:2692754-Pyramimonas_sp.AAC.1